MTARIFTGDYPASIVNQKTASQATAPGYDQRRDIARFASFGPPNPR